MITGTLKVHALPGPDDIGFPIVGQLYGDTATHGNHPFPDATVVHTSRVQEILLGKDGCYVTTRNSFYKVEEYV